MQEVEQKGRLGRMSKRVIQKHHIRYSHPDHPTQKEIVVKLTKGEHRIVTLLSMYTQNFVSKGLIICLKEFLALNEHRAEEL